MLAPFAAGTCMHEAKLLDRAIDRLKERCRREAESQRFQLTVSLDELTSEVSPDAPALPAEALERMMSKFHDKSNTMGFSVCVREMGTWKVHVDWGSKGS